jgi:phosphatidylserine decarboxylase
VRIFYYNRLAARMAEEVIFEEGAMRFLYGNPFGRLLVELVIRRPFFSRIYGRGKKSPESRAGIRPFVERYGIDISELEKPIESFSSFNDFFIRKLKDGARPVDPRPEILVAPADSKLIAHSLRNDSAFPVKGRPVTLGGLTGGGIDTRPWREGMLLVFRLCPADCHRFHYFDSCVHGQATTVPGFFHSVSPIAIGSGADVLGGNYRQWTVLDTDHFEAVLEVDVAALTVDSVVQRAPGGGRFRRGDEKGYFQYGGSTIVLAFRAGAARLDQDIVDASARGIESSVRALSAIGKKGGDHS